METVEEHYEGDFRRKVTRKSFKIEEVSAVFSYRPAPYKPTYSLFL